jgi:hypothetical protein
VSDLIAGSQGVPQSVSASSILAATDHSSSAPRVATSSHQQSASAAQSAQARSALLSLLSGTPAQQAAKARAYARQHHLSFFGSGW